MPTGRTLRQPALKAQGTSIPYGIRPSSKPPKGPSLLSPISTVHAIIHRIILARWVLCLRDLEAATSAWKPYPEPSCLPVCLHVCLPDCPSVRLSACLPWLGLLAFSFEGRSAEPRPFLLSVPERAFRLRPWWIPSLSVERAEHDTQSGPQ